MIQTSSHTAFHLQPKCRHIPGQTGGFQMSETKKENKVKSKVIRVWFCLAAVWVLLMSMAACTAQKPKTQNLLLITMDTTRSDYIDTGEGAFAYTPALKKFAKSAAVFSRAYTPITQTLPAHLSILTGRYPHENGVLSNSYFYDSDMPMIQQVLKEKGYRTAAVVSLGTLSSDTGIAVGFDRYLEGLNKKDVFYTGAARITVEGKKLLRLFKKVPFFLFLHYSDPHSPYAPPDLNAVFRIEVDGKIVSEFNAYKGAILRLKEPLVKGTHTVRFSVEAEDGVFDGFILRHLKTNKQMKVNYSGIQFSEQAYRGSFVIKGKTGSMQISGGPGHLELFQVIPSLTWKAAQMCYRREVEYMDRQIGNLLTFLESEGLMKNTAVVITADHGEGLGERDLYFGHVRYLNRQFIQVPLMIYWPGQSPIRVNDPVSHVHIAPTLLRRMKIKQPGFREDWDILDTKFRPRSPVYSFAYSPSALKDKLSVISWPYQCIAVYGQDEEPELEYYNLALSSSHRKWDNFSGQALSKHAMSVYRLFQQSTSKMIGFFKAGALAKVNQKTKDNTTRTPTEKLKTLGYVN